MNKDEKELFELVARALENHGAQLAELNTPAMDIGEDVTRKLTIARERHRLQPQLDAVRPDESYSVLWAMQTLLMLEAQQQLGPRDTSKKIYRPTFDAEGDQPRVRFAKNGDGAWAEMTEAAAGNWRQCIFQMAHESVHLLDQTAGCKASVLEEGTAVAFARHTCALFGFDMRSTMADYARACTLVKQLPGGVTAAKKLRQAAGSFDRVTLEHLLKIGVPQSDAARYLAPLSALAPRKPLRLAA